MADKEKRAAKAQNISIKRKSKTRNFQTTQVLQACRGSTQWNSLIFELGETRRENVFDVGRKVECLLCHKIVKH